MNEKNINTQKDAIIYVINNMPVGQRFYGWELQQMVAEYIPKASRCYVDTILRSAREYCREKYRAINAAKSLYERI